MDSKYKISVIVPVYNAEKYLEETVKSLINQTMNGIEIIFVNDGSTDNSINILNKYKKENVKIINQSNKGVIEARIVGFNQATGNYITFVDNDDILDRDMYKKMYSKAKEENAVDSYQKDMLLIDDIFSKEPKFLTFFSHVLIDDKVKCDLIDQSFKGTVNTYIVNFLKLLVKKLC